MPIYTYIKRKNSSPSLLFSPAPSGPHPRAEPPFPQPTCALAQGPCRCNVGPMHHLPQETPIPPAHLALIARFVTTVHHRSFFKTAMPAQRATPSPDPSAIAALPRLASIRTVRPFHRRCGVLAKRRPDEPPLPVLYSPDVAASAACQRGDRTASSRGR